MANENGSLERLLTEATRVMNLLAQNAGNPFPEKEWFSTVYEVHATGIDVVRLPIDTPKKDAARPALGDTPNDELG